MGLAIIDVRTGRVHAPPLNSQKWPYMLPIASTDFQYPEYRVDSKLFIRNACPEGLQKRCWTYYFKRENDVFNVLARMPVRVPTRVHTNAAKPAP
jgi:hypothetical protein